MGLLSFLGFGSGKIKEALKKGAVVIDVRTPQEFDRGHIPEAIHIPVDRIRIQAPRIKAMNRPVILCCNSGTRSGQALTILRSEGVKEIFNGGNWEQLLKMVRSN
jgi:rhodanese-related sulfurtransferase